MAWASRATVISKALPPRTGRQTGTDLAAAPSLDIARTPSGPAARWACTGGARPPWTTPTLPVGADPLRRCAGSSTLRTGPVNHLRADKTHQRATSTTTPPTAMGA